MPGDAQPASRSPNMPTRVPGYQVVIIELFAGIMPATAALHKLGVHSITYFSEIANDPLELVAIHWPNAIPIGDIESLTEEHLIAIAQRHPGALFWIIRGLPGIDLPSNYQVKVSTRLWKSAVRTKTVMSSLVANLVFTFECTRMENSQKDILSKAFGVEPVEIDNSGFAPLDHPRWWWIGGKPFEWKDAKITQSRNPSPPIVRPCATPTPWWTCVLPGYWPCSLSKSGEGEAHVPLTNWLFCRIPTARLASS